LKNGNLKARGLAYRRSDTPRFIKEAQLSILKILSNARDLKEYHALFGKAEEEHNQWREELQSGNVSQWRLVMTRRLTRDANSHKADTWTSLAGRQYEQAGIKLHAGERISFLLKNVSNPLKQERVIAAPFIKPGDNYDLRKYDQMLNHAVEELWCTTPRRDVSSPVDPNSSLLLPLS
jgi:DNA polymerase elongation subunit (family B)